MIFKILILHLQLQFILFVGENKYPSERRFFVDFCAALFLKQDAYPLPSI
nr:MAG TPA: hypothetical protein [Caudoviricetes sp.]